MLRQYIRDCAGLFSCPHLLHFHGRATKRKIGAKQRRIRGVTGGARNNPSGFICRDVEADKSILVTKPPTSTRPLEARGWDISQEAREFRVDADPLWKDDIDYDKTDE